VPPPAPAPPEGGPSPSPVPQHPRHATHDLRRTAATLLLVQGVVARTTMETLGHSQISLTLNTCSHVLPTLKGAAATKIDEIPGALVCQCARSTQISDAESEELLRKVVSRLGIEPRTRRLRAIGAPSSGVWSVVLCRKAGGSPSTGVLRLDLCPAVSVSVGVSAIRSAWRCNCY
jgi:hypothetical protein